MYESTRKHKIQLATTVALLIGISAVYISHFDNTLSYDEVYTLRHYAVSPDRALLSYTTPNNHLLHSLLVWFSVTIGDTNAIFIRFPAFASALLAVAMMIRVGTRLAGFRPGIASAVLLATLSAQFAPNARGNSLTVLLALILLDLLYFARYRLTRSHRYTLLVVSMAMILTMPSMSVFIICVIVWQLLEWRLGNQSLRVTSGKIIPLIIGGIAGAIFYMPSFFVGLFAQHFAKFGVVDLPVVWNQWQQIMLSPPVAGLVLLFGLPVGLIIGIRKRGNYHTLLRWAVIVVVGALCLALLQRVALGKFFLARVYLYLLVPLTLLAGIGISKVVRQWTVVGCFGLFFLSIFQLHDLNAQIETDHILAYAESKLTSTDMLIVGCCLEEPVWYYLERAGDDGLLYYGPEKNHLFIVETEWVTHTTLLQDYALDDKVDQCAFDDTWAPLSVVKCSFSKDVR